MINRLAKLFSRSNNAKTARKREKSIAAPTNQPNIRLTDKAGDMILVHTIKKDLTNYTLSLLEIRAASSFIHGLRRMRTSRTGVAGIAACPLLCLSKA